LGLDSNDITDLSPLAGMVRLQRLSLWGNRIEDISPLETMVRLEELWLDRNPISKIDVIARFRELRILGLSGTAILDLTPLVGNPGLASGDEIDLRDVGAEDPAFQNAIDQLRQRGASVRIDP